MKRPKRIEGPPPSTGQLRDWYQQEADIAEAISAGTPEAESKSSPNHYQGAIQCIDVIKQLAEPEAFVEFCRFSALQYLWRCGGKEGESKADDMGKAGVYLAWGAETAKEHGL
jgi:hypothetical protein